MNPAILKKIDEACKDDDDLKLFLKDLVMLEANESPGWWKPVYREKIDKYMKE